MLARKWRCNGEKEKTWRGSKSLSLSISPPLSISPFSLHFIILSSLTFPFLVCSPFPLHFLILSSFSRKPLHKLDSIAISVFVAIFIEFDKYKIRRAVHGLDPTQTVLLTRTARAVTNEARLSASFNILVGAKILQCK